ncbi:MAG: substrate-binding domain-containing protein [Marinobacterium sp.]|nr:substrate-binding domain-containing protein [Marinobacterium sp.]
MKVLTFLLAMLPLLVACNSDEAANKARPQLLIYCGITMAHPVEDIAKIVAKELDIEILVSQGGSEDLYKSLSASRQGDLYLPGSAAYRTKHHAEGLLGDVVHVGYNQAAFIVQKGNPDGIKPQLSELLRNDVNVVVGNAQTGSIGKETKRILDRQGIYQQVLENTVFVTTDSRNLNKALREGEADLIVNWRATAFFRENRDAMEIVDLPPALATPKKLLINQLTFSRYPEAGQYFMEFAASERGQEIFRSYGFLDNSN